MNCKWLMNDFNVVTEENVDPKKPAVWLRGLKRWDKANGRWYGEMIDYHTKEIQISASVQYLLDWCIDQNAQLIHSNLCYVLKQVDPVTPPGSVIVEEEPQLFSQWIVKFLKEKLPKLKMNTLYKGDDFIVFTAKSHNQVKKCRKILERKARSKVFTPQCSSIMRVGEYRRMAIYDTK